MQLKWFRIPVGGSPEIEEELNAFLRGRRVLAVTRELVERDSAPGWAVCVEYQEPSGTGDPRSGGSGRAAKKIDYREVLSEADFAVFSQLRELRKSLAESEGVPVYAIFTNEQLADVAKARPPVKAALGNKNNANNCTVSNRNHNNPDNRWNNNGFRLARSSGTAPHGARSSRTGRRSVPTSPGRQGIKPRTRPRPARVGPSEAVSKAPGGGIADDGRHTGTPPVGVGRCAGADATQGRPWALGRNPVGILMRHPRRGAVTKPY